MEPPEDEPTPQPSRNPHDLTPEEEAEVNLNLSLLAQAHRADGEMGLRRMFRHLRRNKQVPPSDDPPTDEKDNSDSNGTLSADRS